jgi:DNA-binding FadR family transcriptional regulator
VSLSNSAVREITDLVPLAKLQPLAEQYGVIGDWARHLPPHHVSDDVANGGAADEEWSSDESAREWTGDDGQPSDDDAAAKLGASDEEWKAALEYVVREFLDFQPIDGDEQFERAARNRKFFESAIAWIITGSSARRARLAAGFKDLQESVAALRVEADGILSDAESNLAWQHDADFHRLYCVAADCPRFGDIVDEVWQKYRETGRPHTLEVLEKTWAEHNAIVDAIKNGKHNDDASMERIHTAIGQHVENGCERWQKQRRCMDAAKLAMMMEFFNRPCSEARRQGQAAFEAQLPTLMDEHLGEWVLYVGAELRGFFPSQKEPYELCEQSGISREDFIVRRVLTPVIEEFFRP